LRPLGVSQNESVHPKLESQPSPDENPESQQTLAGCLMRSDNTASSQRLDSATKPKGHRFWYWRNFEGRSCAQSLAWTKR
ncbi:hypothetical protein, partial [Bradyrhizobium sp. 197]|uniref:hypothetical protein n=1 Tax=Bradyrhizobium sp. 197 TaxID=2782663 RepID=UPI001FF96B93